MGEVSFYSRLRTWEFWRNQMVYLCLFSVLGHWFEFPYCVLTDTLFGIVEDDSLVWDDIMYPFPVYGIGSVICVITLVPLRDWLCERLKRKTLAAAVFYALAVLFSMCMELAQGFLQNQPDENGVYPLWDNSQLPLNILGQAWLVNDVLIALIVFVYVWALYPFLERCIAKLPKRVADIGAAVVVVAFVALCAVKFS